MPQLLTPNERRVLAAVADFRRAHGRGPSQREVAQLLGYRSSNSVRQYYRALKRKGCLELQSYRWRGVEVTLPIVGQVACGRPALVADDVLGYLPVEARLLGGDPGRFLIVEARGDSMDRAGIEAGDYLLVRRQQTAEAGETVVARLGDEVTVKIYKPHPRQGLSTLVPRSSNPSHRPIVLSEPCGIVALVRRVFKRRELDRIDDRCGEFTIAPAAMMGVEDADLGRISFGTIRELEDLYACEALT